MSSDADVPRELSGLVVPRRDSLVDGSETELAAASAARNGAQEIQAAKQLALEAIQDAQAAGFTVGENL